MRAASQLSMFGQPKLFEASNGIVTVRVVDARDANSFVAEHHYAGSSCWASKYNLGVFHGGDICGVLQFGPGMNPASGASVVAGTQPHQWLELNRMVLFGAKPKYCASQAISLSLRLIRSLHSDLQWIQTFADERCGKNGAVYRACSFLYLGYHSTDFYRLDGEWFHQSMVGRKKRDSRGWWHGPKCARLAAGIDRATKHTFKQYRFFKPLTKWARRNLILPVVDS